MAITHATWLAHDAEGEEHTSPHLAPGAEELADQSAELILRTLPQVGPITVGQAYYEYHHGFCRVQRGGTSTRVEAHALFRLELVQTLRGGAGQLPVWTWRDKRRLVSVVVAGSHEHAGMAEIGYVDPSDVRHLLAFPVDSESRAAFLSESGELSAAIARRTQAMLRMMMAALDRSPLSSLSAAHGEFRSLMLGDHQVRSDAVATRLATVDPDLPLDPGEQRRLTLGIEQLQRMLVFAEGVVIHEAAIVASAVRDEFTEVQGSKAAGWREWVPGTAQATYAQPGQGPEDVLVPVLLHHDRDHGALHIVEAAPQQLTGHGRLREGWAVRSFDAARLLSEAGEIVAALGRERDDRRHSRPGRVGGVVAKLHHPRH